MEAKRSVIRENMNDKVKTNEIWNMNSWNKKMISKEMEIKKSWEGDEKNEILNLVTKWINKEGKIKVINKTNKKNEGNNWRNVNKIIFIFISVAAFFTWQNSLFMKVS